MRNTLRVRAPSCLAALVLLAASSCSWVKEKIEGVMQDQRIAQEAVTRFHERLDQGQYREIYAETDEEFRKGMSEADFTALLEAVSRKLGKVQGTQVSGFKLNYEVGLAKAEIGCETQFAEGKAAEEFVWRIRDGQARLLRYDIKSPLLIIK